MKLYETLEEQLKQEPNFVTDDGELKKWVVINKAQNLDEELIGLLLDNQELKEKFFVEVKGTMVFNQNLFIQFLEQKNYLNDSYTQFKNKVGLTIDGKYLKQRNEVALVWPFKDCILEGGQSHEEQNREEIFFNETLAQDEITQLLEPKVLTNAKTYNKQGENPFEKFNRDSEMNKKRELPEDTITDNLLIKGNNLLALHSLKKEFAGKVKLIYIDPPYNTGNDEFNYNDNFNHSTWLTFMKNRLEIAKTLMKDSGQIFVQCDYHEDPYLKVLMDEVFGSKNFVQSIAVKMSSASGPKMAHVKTRIPKLKDIILVYKKKDFILNKIPSAPKGRWDKEYSKILYGFNFSDFEYINNLINENGIKKEAVDRINSVLKNVKLRTISQTEFKNQRDNEDWLKNNSWRIVADKQNTSLDKSLAKKEIHPNQDVAAYLSPNDNIVLYRTDKDFGKDSRVEIVFAQNNLTTNPCDLWLDISTSGGFSEEGGVSLPKGKKPEKLLQRIIEMSTYQNEIVLDFFSGTGTTAAVGHKLERQYIGIEQLDYGKNDILNRLQNVVNGDQTGISNNMKWEGGGSFTYLELKKYNQTFIEQIEEAKDSEALLDIWEQMIEKSFLNYNVDIKKQEEHIEEFKQLTVKQQKQHLLELLDKNQLYVNLSSLEDEGFARTDEDEEKKEKKVTKDFYQIKK
jgi:adenine-specific DNA-methyltransferase